MRTKEILSNEIQNLQEKLKKEISRENLSHQGILKLSQELDLLILEYQRQMLQKFSA